MHDYVKVLGHVMIPIGLGGVSGLLEACVVDGDVPLLFPVKTMEELGALVDVPGRSMLLRKLSVIPPPRRQK